MTHAINRLKTHKNNEIKVFNRPLATMNKLLAPCGCAKTLKPLMDHVDLEIAETLKRQQKFDSDIQKEYSKLNFPLDFYLKNSNSIKKTSKSSRKRVLSAVLLSKNYPSTKEKIVSPRKNKIIKYKELKNMSLDPLIHTFDISFEKLPPLIKSTPLHLDPRLRFPKKNSSNSQRINGERLNSVNNIIENCKKNNKSRICNIDKGIKCLKDESNDISSFIDDVIDSVKFSKNHEKVENSVAIRHQNRRIDKLLKIESKNIQKELNESVKKIMGIGLLKHKGTPKSK